MLLQLSFSSLVIICYQIIRAWLTTNCLEQNEKIRANSISGVEPVGSLDIIISPLSLAIKVREKTRRVIN